jgi:hypothetical protein
VLAAIDEHGVAGLRQCDGVGRGAVPGPAHVTNWRSTAGIDCNTITKNENVLTFKFIVYTAHHRAVTAIAEPTVLIQERQYMSTPRHAGDKWT